MPRGKQWEYVSYPVRRNGPVARYMDLLRETNLLPTWEACIAYLIESLDPDWDLLREAGVSDDELLQAGREG